MRPASVVVIAVLLHAAGCDWPPCDGAECGYDPGPDGPPTISAGADVSLADVAAAYPDEIHNAPGVVTALGGSNRFRLSGSIAGVVVEAVSGAELLASGPDTFEFRATALEGRLTATSTRADTTIAVPAKPVAALALVPYEYAFTARTEPTTFAVLRGAAIELVLHVAAADGTRLVDLGSAVTGSIEPSGDRWDLYTVPVADGAALPLSLSAASRTDALTIPVVDGIDEITVVRGARTSDPAQFPSVGSGYVCVEGRRNGIPVAGLAWSVSSDATYTRQGAPTSLVPDGGCAFVDAGTAQVTFAAAGLQRTFPITLAPGF